MLPRPLLAALAVVLAACGTVSAGATPTSSAPTSSTSVPSTTVPELIVHSNAAAQAAAPPTTRPPQPPLGDVVVVGDSLSAGLVAPLRAALDTDQRDVDWRWWVGFTVPNPSGVWHEVLTESRPDVAVLFFAAWESEVVRDGSVIDPSDPDWAEVYRRDFVEPWVDRVRTSETRVVWVAMPRSADPAVSAHHQALNEVWRSVADTEPMIDWVDAVAIVADDDGSYREFDTSNGHAIRLINLDGMHLCAPATGRVADAVLDVLADRFSVDVNSGWQRSGWAVAPGAFGVGECPAPGDRVTPGPV